MNVQQIHARMVAFALTVMVSTNASARGAGQARIAQTLNRNVRPDSASMGARVYRAILNVAAPPNGAARRVMDVVNVKQIARDPLVYAMVAILEHFASTVSFHLFL